MYCIRGETLDVAKSLCFVCLPIPSVDPLICRQRDTPNLMVLALPLTPPKRALLLLQANTLVNED